MSDMSGNGSATLALVGMDVSLPWADGVAALERALFLGTRPKEARAEAALESPAQALEERLVRASLADLGFVDSLRLVCAGEGGLTSSLASAREALAVGRAEVVTVLVTEASFGAAVALVREETCALRGLHPYALLADARMDETLSDLGAVFLDSLSSSSQADERGIVRELEAVISAPRAATCALVADVVGDVGSTALASMLSLIVAALGTRYGYIHASLEGARLALDEASSFFQPSQPHPWFTSPKDRRRAAVSSVDRSRGRLAAGILVSGDAGPAASRAEYAPVTSPLFLRVAGRSEAELEGALDGVVAALARGDVPSRVAAALSEPASRNESMPLRLALVGRNAGELTAEAAAARRALRGAMAQGGEWQTPRGSCFAARPLGPSGAVAFVYPGAFSAYVGLARRLLRVFPKAYDRLGEIRSDLGSAFAEHLLYPRFSGVRTVQAIAAAEARLAADAVSMIESGMAASFVYTSILRDTFGVRPSAAFGYSMGELTMLWSLGVWRDGDAAGARLRQSPLFRSRLGGPLDAVEAWRARRGVPSTGEASWASYVIIADAEEVMRAVEAVGERQAFLTIVNTPSECVVAGTPAACQRVVERLGCQAMQTPVPNVLHAPDVLAEETSALSLVTTRPVHDVGAIKFYSAADYAPLTLGSEPIARSLVRMCQNRLDFVRLVRRVYEDGARIFIEVGPAGSCTRLLTSALSGREHVAVAIDRRGADEEASVLKVMAKLYVHHVPLSLPASA